MSGMVHIDPEGVREAAQSLRQTARQVTAGDRLGVPSLPGNDGGLAGAYADLAAAEGSASASVAEDLHTLASRLEAVVTAATTADIFNGGPR